MRTLAQCARCLHDLGEDQAAASLLERAHTTYKEALGADHPITCRTGRNLSAVLQDAGDWPRAEQVLRGLRQHDQAATFDLAAMLHAQGRDAEARALYEEAVQVCEAELGAGHSWTLVARANELVCCHDAGLLGPSMLQLEQDMPSKETRRACRRVAQALAKGPAAAEPLLRARLEAAEACGSGVRAKQDLATLLVADPERSDEGVRLLEQVERSESEPRALAALNQLGLALHRTGRPGAEERLRTCLERREQALGASHVDTLLSLHNLGVVLTDTQPREAESLLRRAVEGREKTLGPGHAQTLDSLRCLAGLVAKPDAEALLRRGLEASEDEHGASSRRALDWCYELGDLLQSMGRTKEARALFQRELEGLEQLLGKQHPEVEASRANLARCEDEWPP